MSKPEMNEKQKTLVKARKAARITFALLIFGGASLLLVGIVTAFLPQVLNGVVCLAASLLPFVLSKQIEKKIDQTLT